MPSTCVDYAPDGASNDPCDSIGMGAGPDLLAAFRDDSCSEAGLSTNYEAVSEEQKSLGGENPRTSARQRGMRAIIPIESIRIV